MGDVETAWAAGLFEGEGSVYAENQNGRRYLRLCLSTTDADVAARFHAAVGVGKVYGPYRGTNRVRYDWRTKNHHDGLCALDILRPFFSERREQQAQNALRAVAEQRARIRNHSDVMREIWRRRRAGELPMPRCG